MVCVQCCLAWLEASSMKMATDASPGQTSSLPPKRGAPKRFSYASQPLEYTHREAQACFLWLWWACLGLLFFFWFRPCPSPRIQCFALFFQRHCVLRAASPGIRRPSSFHPAHAHTQQDDTRHKAWTLACSTRSTPVPQGPHKMRSDAKRRRSMGQ